MSKVMIVEDDDSLREIYAIRLTAEGYAVISARDGEEALAVAVRERPDLIISDVMMPKISGFDMLDILRSTPETQNIKVIMMTALSSEDQRERGENLGADRYIVKSQVGIEDVVNVVHEVLGDRDPSGKIDTTAPVETLMTNGNMGNQQAANAGQAMNNMSAVPAQPVVLPATEQVVNAPTQAMPPVGPQPVMNNVQAGQAQPMAGNTQVGQAQMPAFTATEQVTNIPTQAMPPVGSQPNFPAAEQVTNIPTQAMPPLPNTPEQSMIVPPSIMPPAA